MAQLDTTTRSMHPLNRKAGAKLCCLPTDQGAHARKDLDEEFLTSSNDIHYVSIAMLVMAGQ